MTNKVRKTTQTEMLMDIRERLVKIETHLEDMNGKLIKHEKFIAEDCPLKHKIMTDKIDSLSDKTMILTTKQSLVYGFIFALLLALISGTIPLLIQMFLV